ncbi:MAG: transposase [Acetobacteraceae bacterium]|nr:transposase [Acetobacteraceae bacterium]MCX7686326.1 transposase [Acetobacteraceae bacterium]MDW8398808.1 transposase [Acetobacteraceae bacterium]
MARFDLTVGERAIILRLLPRTPSAWRDLPERFGPQMTVCKRYNPSAKAGVWLRVFDAPAARSSRSPN